MVRFIVLSCLTLSFLSCRQEASKEYYWIRLRGHEYEKIDTVRISRFNNIRHDDTTTLSYTSRYGTSTYFIIPNKDSSFILEPKELGQPNDGIVYLRQITDTSLVVKNESFNVKKIILYENVIDGASIHYYEPTFGIYVVHSNTWTSLRYLQTNDTSLNKKILTLIKATIPAFFLRGKLAVE